METVTFNFPYNARTTYTAITRLFEKRTQFCSVKCNDALYVVEARRGAWFTPFSESIKLKVAATGTDSCAVKVESSSRSWLNILNPNANSNNVSDLSDYISNEVYRLLPVNTSPNNRSEIRIAKPEIRFV